MDILLLHDNYPGQFRHLAPLLAARPEHRVVFATGRSGVTPQQVFPGLEVVTYVLHRPPSPQTHRYLRTTEECVLRGQAVARAVHQLQQQGLRPRLVIFHVGKGLGLFLRALLPDALLIGYCEWFFRPDTLDGLLEQVSLDDAQQVRMRNLTILQELSDMDRGVVPTAWQQRQFPPEYQARLQVQFDGIDTDVFQPGSLAGQVVVLPLEAGREAAGSEVMLEPEDPVLSYVGRGMEPLRGFPEFLRLLPPLLRAEPRLQVVVAGRDRRVYSYGAPSHGGSWKEHLLHELGAFPGRERIHFVGGLASPAYRTLLQRSDLHLYFSRPYVPSWSLFEAAACGTPILMNEGPTTTGTLPEAAFARVDLNQAPELLARQVQQALQRSLAQRDQPRRSRLPAHLALPACLRSWAELLNESLGATGRPAGSGG